MATTKRDYYEILGIPKTASLDEVKRAYRGLAMKHHPDRVEAAHKKEAEEKFKEISEAYAVLSDPQKRQVYDQHGHSGFDQRYSTEDIFRNADFSSVFGEMGGSGSIFEEILGGMFGGAVGASERRSGRGSDLEMALEVSFEEAAKGVTQTVVVPRKEICEPCKGKGGERANCPTCQGRGQVRQSAGFITIARTCSRCSGEGSIVKKPCATCKGAGRIRFERKIQVKVPAGVETGMRLRLSGEGEGGERASGDLYVHLRVAPHEVFRRDGANLLVDYPVSIAQTALGAEVAVPSLNGRVSMKIPAGSQSGTVFRVRGKGLPDIHHGGHGDLLVRANVETPTNLTQAQRKFLEEMGKVFTEDAHPLRRSFLSRVKSFMNM